MEWPAEGFERYLPRDLWLAAGAPPAYKLRQRERAIVIEPHPVVRAALEHLLLRAGYAVEVCGEVLEEVPGKTAEQTQVLLLVGTEGGGGSYVFRTQDVAGVLTTLNRDADLPGEPNLPVFGGHAFVPKPFGVMDILRAVYVVSSFGGRKEGPPRKA